MYSTSQNWKENIYKTSIHPSIKVYIDDILLNSTYLLELKKGCELFEDGLELGSVPSQYIEMKIHKKAQIRNPKIIRIEYGILLKDAIKSEFEMIPMGVYHVDDFVEEDDNTCSIKALDNIIQLDRDDGYYDASTLIALKGYATIGEIAQDICSKKGLVLETSSFLNSDKKIAVYDNQLTAREYMSYIAESAGGFCCANRLGKIEFRKIGQEEENIPLKLFKTYEWGEEYSVSKVSYEDGVRSFKFGDETRNTLWIRQENLFIVEEEQVQRIYENIKGLTINSFEGTTIINPAIDIGDKIMVEGKAIIYQGEMNLNKRFMADIKSKLAIKEKQETTIKKENQKIINRRVQSEINQIDGKIVQLVQETEQQEEEINSIGKTNMVETDSSIHVKNVSKENYGQLELSRKYKTRNKYSK